MVGAVYHMVGSFLPGLCRSARAPERLNGADRNVKSDDAIAAFWESAWDALDASDPKRAFSASEAFLAAHGDVPEAHHVAGVALAHAGRDADALDRFERAAALAPDWPDPAIAAARTLFRLCRFGPSRERLAAVLRRAPRVAEAQALEGLLLERAGEETGARAAFERAHRIDPETYPRPVRLDEAAFQREIERALARLPEVFRDAVENTAIVLEPVPPVETLLESDPPHDPEILGLYVGVPRPEQSVDASGSLPGVIHLFQRNLERSVRTRRELSKEIAITLYHEIAHALGFEEEDMADLGLE